MKRIILPITVREKGHPARAYVENWKEAYRNNTGLLLFGDVFRGQGGIYRQLRRVGRTTYKVRVHFSQTSAETMSDKIKRMLKNEIQQM